MSILPESIRKAMVRRRLAATLKPDPAYRAKRLAQFDAARKERYFRNVEGLR